MLRTPVRDLRTALLDKRSRAFHYSLELQRSFAGHVACQWAPPEGPRSHASVSTKAMVHMTELSAVELPNERRRIPAGAWKIIGSAAVVVGGIASLMSGRTASISEVLASISRFPAWALLGALGLGLLQNVLQASRLWTLLPGAKRLPWLQVVRSFIWGQLINKFVPARAGDVAKIALIRKISEADGLAAGTSAASLAGSVLIADKFADVGSLLLLLALATPAWLRDLSMPTPSSPWAARGIWIVALAIAAALFALSRRPLARARGVALQVLRGSSGLIRLPRLLQALAFGAASWMAEAVIFRLFASAMGFELGSSQTLWVLVVLNLGIALPVSFANIGTFEASVAFGLSRFGVPTAQGVAIATVHHLVQVGCTLLLAGAFGLFARNRGAGAFRVQERDKRRALDYYDGLSSAYDDHVAKGLLKYFRDREHRAVLGFAGLDGPAKRRLIDVGCGGGFYALAARRSGLHVSAVDLAPGMVQRLESKVDEAWVGDVEKLQVTSTYDIVICAGVLDFVLDPERAFKNLAALVAPGGRLVVHAPRAGVAGWIYRLEKKALGIEVNLFSLAWFATEARKWGLQLVAYEHPLPTNRVLLFERPAAASRAAAGEAESPAAA